MYSQLALFVLLCSALVCGHPIGGELGERPGAFIDVVKESSGWQTSAGAAVSVDSQGWPTVDAQITLFDDRPFGAWAPPADDPQNNAPNDSGVYQFTFLGKGTPGGYVFGSLTYSFNPSTYVTTGSFTVSPGNNFVVLTFSNTQRNASSPTNTGITNLRVIRPGYAIGDDLTKIFTDIFLAAHAPFDHLRYMGWRDTNYQVSNYGSPLGGTFDWASRRLPTDAHQSSDRLRAGTQGVAWEYIILLANKLNQDVWINIPVQATGTSASDTSSYIYQLALLFKNGNTFTGGKGLNSNLNIYIEHSNEVWNGGFSQYNWNKQQAITETSQNPNSNLNIPAPSGDAWGTSTQDIWAQRRHLRRVREIGQIFVAVFGAGTRIRPIYAHFTLPTFQYQNNLAWYSSTFGAPSALIWGVAQTKYYDDGAASSTATVDQVVSALNASSYDSGNRANTIAIHSIAQSFNLQHTSYEGGAGVANQNTVNLANRIMAHRSPTMRQVVANDFRDNWQALGGGLYNYFTVCGGYSRYGMWGLTDDLGNLSTPKYLGIQDVIRSFGSPTSPPTPVPTSPPTPKPTSPPTPKPTTKPTSAPTAAPTCVPFATGSGTGLTGHYYSDQSLTNLVGTQVDPTIDVNWGSGGPAILAGQVDHFSVQWTGFVQPRFSGSYTFYAASDDGARVIVNGTYVVNAWVDRGTTESSGSITLVKGVKYPITYQYYENGGGAEVHLKWSSTCEPKAVTPQTQLFP